MFSPALLVFSLRIRLPNLRYLSTDEKMQILNKVSRESSIYRIVFSTPSRRRNNSETHVTTSSPSSTSSSLLLSTSPPDELYLGMDTVDNVQTSLDQFFAPVIESLNTPTTKIPPIVGWERNPQQMNKLVPKFVDCSHQLNPKVLSNDAVHLNLKLMKWRLLPDIDLEIVQKSRCLLLGAGTLGCNIARLLMAWGVSKITFVDSGHISYSNPVRQTLYIFKDCIPSQDGKLKSKAQAAAESLRMIYPGVDSEGVYMSVPMPGHSVSPAIVKQVQQDVQCLEQLIQNHDIIFLLMDTRESRWLPTLIAASKHKASFNNNGHTF